MLQFKYIFYLIILIKKDILKNRYSYLEFSNIHFFLVT